MFPADHWRWVWIPWKILARHMLWLWRLRHGKIQIFLMQLLKRNLSGVFGRQVCCPARPKTMHLLCSHCSWDQQCWMSCSTIWKSCFVFYLSVNTLLCALCELTIEMRFYDIIEYLYRSVLVGISQTSYFSFFLNKSTFWAKFFSTWKRVNCGKISQNFSKFSKIYHIFPNFLHKYNLW